MTVVISPTKDFFKRWCKQHGVRPMVTDPQLYRGKDGTEHLPVFIAGNLTEHEKLQGVRVKEVIDIVPERMANWFGPDDADNYMRLKWSAKQRTVDSL